MDKIIKTHNLSKVFINRETFSGVLGTLKSLFCTKQCTTVAIKELSFEVKTGERVAFIGPNGAGKSTVIKMLTGIILPTSGQVEVLGLSLIHI